MTKKYIILNRVGEVHHLSPDFASQYKVEWQGKITEMPISAFARLFEYATFLIKNEYNIFKGFIMNNGVCVYKR